MPINTKEEADTKKVPQKSMAKKSFLTKKCIDVKYEDTSNIAKKMSCLCPEGYIQFLHFSQWA